MKTIKPTYIAFNKPYGVLSQFTPEAGHKSLKEFNFPPDIYPVGRLDHDSEGLLLLSNDGVLIKKLLDPKNAHPRTYLAQLEGVPKPQDLEKLTQEIKFKDFTTKPCKAYIVDAPCLPDRIPPIRERKNIPTSWLKLTLTEGKNRQVRKMTAHIGFPTLRLVRIAIGNLTLADLKVAEWRFVDKSTLL